MVTRRNFTLTAAAAALTAAVPAMAKATVGPDLKRPVTIIVPFAKGGTTDQMARLIAEPLAKALGVAVKVDNITGDWGTTGTVVAAKAAADGHTLVMGQTATHVIAGKKGMPARYDAVKDFAPIGLVGTSPITFVVRNSLPVKDLADLHAYLTVYPEPMAVAHGGHGTPSHLGGRKLMAAFGREHIGEKPYASTMAALQDLSEGRADIMATSLPQALPFIKAGKVKALGTAETRRSPALPEVHTGTQQGYADLRASHWNGLFAPKGIDAAVQAKLAEALSAALDDGATRRKMEDLGIHVPFNEQRGPQALANLQQQDIADLRDEMSAVA